MQQEQHSYEMPDNFNSILLGASVIVAIGLVPYLSLVNAFCCMGLLIAGAASVYHYTTRFGLTLTSGDGFRLGLYAGILGGLASLVISYTLQLAFGYKTGSELIGMMKELQLSMIQNDPETAREIEAAFREAEESELSLTQMIFGTGVTLIVDPLFAGIGGAIGSALFKRGK
ncbi:MAG: hypothetical protein HGA87_03535 [Desulfobulbaceae bacterium]|jgi:hypothetical protein|nr:hypothetical protein [Desulfobulbaceae bacterium]